MSNARWFDLKLDQYKLVQHAVNLKRSPLHNKKVKTPPDQTSLTLTRNISSQVLY
jgi:hypothetical protein